MTARSTRRRLLQFGALGTALLGVGCALRWAKTGYALPHDEDPPVALTVKEFLVVRAAVEALFPASGAFPSGISVGVHRRVDEEVFAQRTDIRDDFTLALHLLEHAPPLLATAHRFTALDVDTRAGVLRSLLEGGPDPLVWLCASLQQMTSVFYYAHPATWPAIHYDGPWVPTAMPPPSSAAYAEALARVKAQRGRTVIT